MRHNEKTVVHMNWYVETDNDTSLNLEDDRRLRDGLYYWIKFAR